MQLLFSRSHIEARWRCPRLQYLNYYYDGSGIVGRMANVALSVGSLTHNMCGNLMTYVMKNGDLPDAVRDNIIDAVLRDDDALERKFEVGEEWQTQRLLAEAMVRGWCRLRLPFIVANYRVLEVEREATLDFAKSDPSMKLMVRIDAELERIEDGELFANECKTTGTNRDNYFESWRYDSQTMAHTWAVEQLYNRPCGGVIMDWMYKGYKREGVIYSPLIRGSVYTDPITGERQSQYESTRRKGWESGYVSQPELPDWITNMPDELLREQYFHREIYRNQDEIDVWRVNTFNKMCETRAGLTHLDGDSNLNSSGMHLYFPARMSAECYNDKYGHRCPYLPICYGQVDDPLKSGEYVRRTPHHEQEFTFEA